MARKSDTVTETAENTEVEETTEAKPASKKSPLPEGYATPVQFTHILKEQRGVEVRPQVIYGYVKNNKAFQEFCGQNEGDGRHMLNIEQGLQWWDEKEQRKAERAAAKEAEATESADA
jgi:hypothetical protein